MLGIPKAFNKAYTDVPKGITHGLTKGGVVLQWQKLSVTALINIIN